MIMENCPQSEALLLALDEDRSHPWQLHVAACPRCQALVRARDAFQDDALADQVPHTDEAAAAANLDTFTSGLPRKHQSRSYATRLLGLAAVLLMGLGLFTLSPNLGDYISWEGLDPGTLEDVRQRADQTAGSTTWNAPSVTTKDGSLVLSWQAHPRADGYRVVFLAPDLTEEMDTLVEAETGLTIDRTEAPATGGFVVVVALQNGRETGRTMPAALP